MTKNFIDKVITKRIVDTKNYRYVLDCRRGTIRRLPIKYLDTTKAETEWEIVYKF